MTSTLARPTRRTIVRGAAWGVPVVSLAAAAPAFAASCNVLTPYEYTFTWGSSPYSHPNGTPNEATATIVSSNGGPTLYASFATVFSGSGVGDGNLPSGESRNLSVPSDVAGSDTTRDPSITNLGGLGAGRRGVRLQQTSAASRNNRQTLTVTFRTGSATGPVKNIRGLSFSIVDIDALTTYPYNDRVEIVPNLTEAQQTKDGNITGLGTQASPWASNQANTNVGENRSGARVRVNYPTNANMTNFSLTYWTNTGATSPNTGQYHRIFLSDFTFKVARC